MKPNVCPECGGKFGLLRQYWWRTGFCSTRCLIQFKEKQERKRAWYRWLFSAP